MGSVKELEISLQPTADKSGSGFFNFKDNYSVFDWGAMPDSIENKGKALALMGAKTFIEADTAGIPTIYKGMFGPRQMIKYDLEGLNGNPSNKMYVTLVRKIPIEDNYTLYDQENLDNYIVPLEVINRRGLPHGSSVFKGIKKFKEKGDTHGLANLINDLGLKNEPKPGDMLPNPKTGFTTKFEAEDRKIEIGEAYRISGLSIQNFAGLVKVQNMVDDVINDTAKNAGMRYWDGKREYVVVDGEVNLADVAGTADEDRFTKDNIALSKQALREANKDLNFIWYNTISEAKEKAQEENIDDWKTLVNTKPDPLPTDFIALVGEMYQATSNAWTGIDFFDVKHLDDVIDDIKDSSYVDYFSVK